MKECRKRGVGVLAAVVLCLIILIVIFVAVKFTGNSIRNWFGGQTMQAQGVAACSDGIKDGNETGVDCGGSCQNKCNPAIGVNLDLVKDWNTAWTFTDAFQSSRQWYSVDFDITAGQEIKTNTSLSLDSKGNVRSLLPNWTSNGHTIRQYAGTLLFRDIPGRWPAGIYHAEWKGNGAVQFRNAVSHDGNGTTNGVHWENLNYSGNLSSGIEVLIKSTDPNNPIRDIHVWMPDYQGQTFAGKVWYPGANFSPFHPLFLERLKPFKVIRFMPWSGLNNLSVEHWEDRPHYDDVRQTTSKGVAYEYMIELSNELHADLWLNMPAKADDNYTRKFATLVRDSLNYSDQKVYIEWVNEVWNDAQTDVAKYINDQLAEARKTNSNTTWGQIVAREEKRDFDIWSEVFAEKHQEDRLIRVVAGQADNTNSWILNEILKNMDGKFDAVSVAGYFGSNYAKATFNANTTAEQVAQATLDRVPVALMRMQWAKNRAIQYSTPEHRIQLVAYEGGESDAANNAPYQQAFYNATKSPLMYQAYAAFLKGYRDMGGDLFLNYVYCTRNVPEGTWGALQYQDQPISEAPKYQALLDAVSGKIYLPQNCTNGIKDGNETGVDCGGVCSPCADIINPPDNPPCTDCDGSPGGPGGARSG